MASFEDNVAKIEHTLGRSLAAGELRLLKLWDLTTRSDAHEAAQAAPIAPVPGQVEYQGRIKIGCARGQYEVYFVCANLMLKPVVLNSKEDVLAFLTQDPINLNEQLVQQAIAAAESFKPTQINQTLMLPEVLLRSMGFRY